MRPPSLLYTAATVLLVVGVSARILGDRLWAPDLSAPTALPAGPVAMPALAQAMPAAPDRTGLAEVVVATNVFSARRSTPEVRFGDSTSAPPPVPVPIPPVRPTVKLFGIGKSGGRATVLLDAAPGVPGAEIYHVGDALPGGGRVVRIGDDHVVIDTPAGRQVLRLRSAP